MKTYITIILLALLQTAYSQDNNGQLKLDKLENRIQSIEKKIEDYEYLKQNQNNTLDSFKKIKHDFQEIKTFKTDQSDIVNQTNQTIQNQNSLISSFGIIYTIITIIIAIIAIGLPLITYQFGIKPSREALKELENNLDKKVADYLKETRNLQIKKSIEHLKGENAELKGQAVSFLSLTQHEGFTDQELFEFYRLIKSGVLSDSHIGTIAYLLSSRVNEYANKIFGDKECLENNAIKSAAYQYIPKVGIQEFKDPLKSFLKDNTNQYAEFFTLLTFTNMYSSKMTTQIFDNQAIVDVLTDETLKLIKSNIKQTLENMKIDKKDFDGTYLSEKIEKVSA